MFDLGMLSISERDGKTLIHIDEGQPEKGRQIVLRHKLPLASISYHNLILRYEA